MARTLQPEDVIAHYRVIGPLGAGGMGEVYLAHDTTLDRDVALKVLPAELVRSEDRVRRFVMEAKSASSLSHPHIVTIYEIGHAPVRSADEAEPAGDEVHYIAMELIKGKTFQELIHKEKADLKTMLRHLAQAAEGLSKAHVAGIVHRDLKPGNIMVTNDGYAKVLDFGLAKLTERGAAADPDLTSAPTEAERTSAGMVVGTVGYMSPEQVKGKIVDTRSDVFSFGCILYEAATRARPFGGESNIDTMHQIVHDNPAPIDGINPEAPAELRRLIKRCLAKNPDQRLQSIKDLAIELREIVDEFDTLSASATSGSITGQPAYNQRRNPMTAAVLAAVVVLGLAGIGFGLWSTIGRDGDGAGRRPFQSMRMSSLMSDSNVFGATLSGDGRYLAYIKGPAGEWSLWVRQVATGSDVQILAPQTVPIRGIGFSADGNYLHYLGRDPETPTYSSLFEVPSLGGTPRKRLFDIDTAIGLAPDGSRGAFIRIVPDRKQDDLLVAEVRTGREEVLATVAWPERFPLVAPAWSPDGSRIVTAWVSTAGGFRVALLAFDAVSGERELVTEPATTSYESIAWLRDGSGLIGTSPPAPGLSTQIFHFPYPKGDRRQVTNDLDAYGDVSLSADGSSVAALRTSRDTSLWVHRIGPGAEGRRILARSTKDGTSNLLALPDGSIVYVATTERHRPVFRIEPDGSGRRQITSQEGWSFNLLSPAAGRGIFFSLFGEAEAKAHVWRLEPDGGTPRQVTDGSGEFLIAVSPDGSTVLFARFEFPAMLWSAPAAGGEPVKLVDDYGGTAIYSPDGRLLLYFTLEEIEGRQRRAGRIIPAGGGEPIARFLPPGDALDFQWLPDGGGVTYTHTVDGVQNLWLQPASGGDPVQVTRFSEGRIDRHRHAPGGGKILLDRSLEGVDNLWTVAPDGTDATRVTDFRDGVIFDTTWAHNGESVISVQGDIRREVVMLNDSPE